MLGKERLTPAKHWYKIPHGENVWQKLHNESSRGQLTRVHLCDHRRSRHESVEKNPLDSLADLTEWADLRSTHGVK